MGKKGVPEWLNSSLWSSSNPSSLHNDRYHIKPETVAPDPLPPPPPPPPPPRPQTLPKEEKRPSRAGTLESDDPPAYDNDPSSLSASSPDEISRQAQLLAELSKKVINAKELRRLASQGIPDGAGIRSTVWKILLGYLPNDRGLWAAELAKKRSQYTLFKEELLVNPDTEIIEQIDRDVKRTHPDMNFFSGDSSFAKSNQEALRHILIVFAKLNPGIRYVQGMNEVLAPLFYVFRNDPDEENAANAEADTFFCFVELLSGFRDHFCQQLDNSVVGIRSTITKLSQLLKEHDEELWRHLEVTTKVNPQFYAFRWITLLLTQEFNFADSLHIWDTLLSDPEGPQETLLRVCCAMLILIRRRLLAGDFTSNLKLLQNYPSSTNISHLLYVADKLRVPASS
ncbi:TBC domain-containing protein C1952.17c-like isoform X2 [Magnolia sinica]|uniref:TBC domain-containing protein C1952.17c-like isoform X2 n=1 Tax=Magnolia sinica TaxID=86752 RepID=UPI00265AF147|nr:TBC domain-containing protein C1952.17c-like isoform X2 [Magnolia sinica]